MFDRVQNTDLNTVHFPQRSVKSLASLSPEKGHLKVWQDKTFNLAADMCRQVKKIGASHDVKIIKTVIERILNSFSIEVSVCQVTL